MKAIRLTAIFLLLGAAAKSQEIQSPEKMILGDTLIFLGIDFSAAVMVQPNKADLGAMIRDKHCNGWSHIAIQIFNHYDFKYGFQKKAVIEATKYFEKSCQKLDSNWIREKYDGLKDEDVLKHIAAYDSLPGEGLGLVMIVNEINLPKDYLSLCSVYLDLGRKRPLKILRSAGNTLACCGYGSNVITAVEYAYEGLVHEDDKYLKALKKCFK